MRRLLSCALAVLLAVGALAMPSITDYTLRAHGANGRYAATPGIYTWSASTNTTWHVFDDAACSIPMTAGFGAIRSDNTFILQASCSFTSSGEYDWAWLISVDGATGDLYATRNVSNAVMTFEMFDPFFGFAPDGAFIYGMPFDTQRSGIIAFNQTLEEVWAYIVCGPSEDCTVDYMIPDVLAVAASGDVLYMEPTPELEAFRHGDIAYKAKQKTAPFYLPSDQYIAGLDAYGKSAFVFNADYTTKLWNVQIPFSFNSTRVSFKIPPYLGATGALWPTFDILADLKGNAYALISYQLPNRDEVTCIVSFSPAGSVNWQSAAIYNASALQQPVLTDDESLFVVVVGEREGNGGWWSAAFDTSSGKMIWNISSVPFDVTVGCHNVLPLSNYTLLYTCVAPYTSFPSYLLAVDQYTGRAYTHGLVSFSGNTTHSLWDSSNNVYLCGSANNAVNCRKFWAPPCLYGSQSCTL